eukprot:11211149-Ditylum_brightwellii.AAC.1
MGSGKKMEDACWQNYCHCMQWVYKEEWVIRINRGYRCGASNNYFEERFWLTLLRKTGDVQWGQWYADGSSDVRCALLVYHLWVGREVVLHDQWEWW